ncbi:MAG: SIS domain-containing protein [Candidatus Heimdallarchaeum aukensis]|uniref:SIS domain-containing protein n=1 Tax=Candidatus Heimdallarchaeum aukensis TaxID=2876573 RepID=A0A9Y1FMN1_9ARCH|nr:MAG: SIS domain-containing protein [Candidatus Heimdallarchaeum aukensis]
MDESKNKESLTENKDLIIFRAIELMIDNLKKNVEHMRKHHEYVTAVRDRLLDDIKNERRIFILASGRSAMVGQMFQTRLEHLGAESRFITNSRSVPRVKEGETIVVISGSGTTPIVKAVLETYLIWNPFVIVITSYPLSVIGRLGDVTVKLIGRTKTDLARREIGLDSTLTPEGTMFESAALSFLDGIVAELAIALNLTEASMFDKHNQGI